MNRYIPFLKLKSSEILAIKELDTELKEEITPFFDFPRKDVLNEETFAYSGEVGHRIRRIPAGCSSVFRPPVPGISATP